MRPHRLLGFCRRQEHTNRPSKRVLMQASCCSKPTILPQNLPSPAHGKPHTSAFHGLIHTRMEYSSTSKAPLALGLSWQWRYLHILPFFTFPFSPHSRVLLNPSKHWSWHKSLAYPQSLVLRLNDYKQPRPGHLSVLLWLNGWAFACPYTSDVIVQRPIESWIPRAGTRSFLSWRSIGLHY